MFPTQTIFSMVNISCQEVERCFTLHAFLFKYEVKVDTTMSLYELPLMYHSRLDIHVTVILYAIQQ